MNRRTFLRSSLAAAALLPVSCTTPRSPRSPAGSAADPLTSAFDRAMEQFMTDRRIPGGGGGGEGSPRFRSRGALRLDPASFASTLPRFLSIRLAPCIPGVEIRDCANENCSDLAHPLVRDGDWSTV